MTHAQTPARDCSAEPRPAALARALVVWFLQNARDLPWRRTQDPYAVWISEIMLQQTQVKTVLPYYTRWMATLPTIAAVANAPLEKLHKLWEGLGYYTRVRNIQRAAQAIMHKHAGTLPTSFDQVLALPGIGPYTAGAICSLAFGQPTAILDGNVARVLSRVYTIQGSPRDRLVSAKLWALALGLVSAAPALKLPRPQSASRPWLTSAPPCSLLNQALMELGALVCTAAAPSCELCPLQHMCTAFKTGRVDQFPTAVKRPKTTSRHFAAFILEHRGRYLVRQRPAHLVNGHLWEFPNIELKGKISYKIAAQKALGTTPDRIVHCATIRHSITRYRMRLDAYRCTHNNPKPNLPTAGPHPARWAHPAELQSLPFPSAHRKIVQQLLANGH